MKKLTFTFLCLLVSFASQAQFSFDIFIGAQKNELLETKHVRRHSGHSLFYNYPDPGHGFQIGVRPQYVLRNYFAFSNETELGLQYLTGTKYHENPGANIKTNFVNSGLMVGLLPFARQKGLHNTLEVKSGIFLNIAFKNDWEYYLYTMPKYNYSFRHALAWQYQAFSTQLFLNFMQTPLLDQNPPPPGDEARFIYHYHSFGFQISYRLF